MITKRNIRQRKDEYGNLRTLVLLDDGPYEYTTTDGKYCLHLVKQCVVEFPDEDDISQMPDGSPIPGEIVALEDEFLVEFDFQGNPQAVTTVFAYRYYTDLEVKWRTKAKNILLKMFPGQGTDSHMLV